MDVVAKLKERIATLSREREQKIAEVNAMTGAIQMCEHLLGEMATPANGTVTDCGPCGPAAMLADET